MQEWLSEIIALLIGLAGGATVGSLVTIKFVRSSSVEQNRPVNQSNIKAGRDNIGGDRIDGRR